MKKAGWFVLSAALGLGLFGTGTLTARAQHPNDGQRAAPTQTASADGHGEFPIGHDHHVGQFSFAVKQTPNGPQGNFEFNELNGQRHTVERILLHSIDQLSIAGHTAHFEGAILWHDRHARVRVIATDDGEHHDSISIRVMAADGHDAGKALYEVGGVLTSGGIHVHAQ